MRRKLRKAAAAWFLFYSAYFIDSNRGRAALASVNMHSVWSLMGWRKFNQVFVHTWVPQLCGRTSNFPVFPSFPTNFAQPTRRHRSHPNNSLLCLFSRFMGIVDSYVAAQSSCTFLLSFLRFRTEMQQCWCQREPGYPRGSSHVPACQLTWQT